VDVGYRPLSLLALAGFLLGALYAVMVPLGGVLAFASRALWLLVLLTVLVPAAAVLLALLFRVRQPRTLLLFAGLALLGLYAVPVGLGGLVAFGQGPWLLWDWTMLVPLAAAALSWVALGRIRASEGTLSGAALCAWGIGLSLFFGVIYAAYRTATSLAVRRQADGFVQDWLGQLKQGNVDKAFLQTVTTSPPNVTRESLEVQYNNPPPPAQTGAFSQFSLSDYVRLIRQAGPEARVQLLNSSWDYEQGGYVVQLKYKVDTPVASFPLDVTVKGVEGRGKEFRGRQWQVVSGATGVPGRSFTFTDAGKALMEQSVSGRAFAQKWLGKLAPQDGNGRDDFPAGLVRTDDFWAIPKFRDEIIEGVRAAFRPKGASPATISLLPVPVPAWTREGDRLRLFCDIQILLRDPQTRAPRFVAEGQLVVEGEAPPGAAPPASWRVERLDLIRGRTAPTGPGAQAHMPPGPG
jgi:hypothetical protein